MGLKSTGEQFFRDRGAEGQAKTEGRAQFQVAVTPVKEVGLVTTVRDPEGRRIGIVPQRLAAEIQDSPSSAAQHEEEIAWYPMPE